jgi:glucose/arabinose dehydrogenase
MRVALPIVALVALLSAVSCGGRDKATPTPSATTSDGLVSIGEGLSGPSGLEATVYATGIVHASAFAFDDDGRLWVATAAYDDTGTDGVYLVSAEGAAPVEIISGLHTALGLLWYDGELYVTSKERVDAYKDFDGTRFGQQRDVIHLPSGVGEVNGITVSPEGRLLVGISAPCDHCEPTLADSAAIISFLPSGGDVQVYASGIRAPIGLTYYPGTSDLFVTMNQRDDLGDATPGDWLAVVSQGDDWGFPDCYGQGGDFCAGVPSLVAALDKHAAVSGVAIVTGQLGADIGNAAVVAEWQTGGVLAVPLVKSGSAYSGTATPLITGIANPVAVTPAPDGALLVGDWTSGTVYRIAAEG